MSTSKRVRCRRFHNPSGVTVLIVLGLLAATLAMSYAMMRTQVTHNQLQHNFDRNLDAHQAAHAGISAALRKMHQGDWAGVGVDLKGALGIDKSYLVTFATGDPTLGPKDPDYAEYPYRVTVTSTGTVEDPSNANIKSTHTIRVIVQLVPRKMPDPPSNWAGLQKYTVYQWGTSTGREVVLNVPVHVEGPVCFQNEIKLCESYPYDADDKAFAGTIDEVALFGTALSAAQIQNLYKNVVPLSTLALNRSLNPVAWWRLDEAAGAAIAHDELQQWDGLYDGAKSASKPAPIDGGGGAAHLDGFNDHIHLGPVDIAGDAMTIVAWFQADNFNVSDGRIISKTTSSSTNSHYWMLSTWRSGDAYRLRFRLKTSSSGTTTLVATSGNFRAGDWVFAAVTYDGSRMKIYKDGVLVKSRSKTGSLVTDSSVFASIGNNPPGSPRARLLRDWEAMRVAGLGDFRPLTGPIDTPARETSAEVLSLLQEECKVNVNTIEQHGEAPVSHPGKVVAYRLYPGGAQYKVAELESTVQSVRLGPDPLTNPLGIFRRENGVRLRDKVQIQGTIIIHGSLDPDLDVDGEHVEMLPVDLPSIYGDSANYQLPVAIVADDIHVLSGSSGSLTGMALTWDETEVSYGSQVTAFDMQGRLIAGEFEVHERSQWDESSSWWKTRLNEFMDQLGEPKGEIYFPQFVEADRGLEQQPKIVFRPDPSGATYHWHDWTQPLFVAHPDDSGLRWDLIEWRDSPQD